jgi:two-component system, NarL family, response regulator NreC
MSTPQDSVPYRSPSAAGDDKKCCPAQQRTRVILADDHVLVREGLTSVLRQNGFDVVGEASDGRAAIAMCEALEPDVVVLDIAMPLLNGIDAARELLKRNPQTKIILLTMYEEEVYVLAGLRAGVTGYVLKSNAASNLVYAIEAVSRCDTYLGPGVSRTVVKAYLSNADVPTDPLSNREHEVLQLIAEGKTVKEIGDVLGVSPRTAETHRTRIANKLGIRDTAGLTRYAIGHGLVRTAQPKSQETSESDGHFPVESALPNLRVVGTIK